MAMSFGEAIGETFFNYMNFRDRASRAEYWWWMLFAFIVSIVAAVLDFAIFRGWEMGPFGLVIGLALFFPSLTVTVRRLHDIGRSGWWILLPIACWFLLFGAFIAALSANPFNPFQGTGLVLILVASLLTLVSFIVIYIVFGIIPSNPGNNRYGPNRYAGA
ncbi:MAG: DUF805 domain-containing protein [Xanthobacteraceae bacterium]|nr:DUF805 domain-containing protein [Xanthobacteraceae bacterium]MCW5674825.1 DUF805 domain-containing protein [Xanthobacteraceae bacterium]